MKTKERQKWLCGISIFAVCFMLTGCCMNHEWKEATCAEPKTCTKCGKTEGEALGHTWVEATCAEPKHCSVCDETEGETLEHTWVEATCAEPKHCSVCGETEGEPLEHTLAEANYQQPATCEVCGETVGEPLQADFEKYGLECNAELNTEYPMAVSYGEMDEDMILTGGEIVFSNYEVFDSDDMHEALKGYEWRVITMTMTLNETDVIFYNELAGGVPIPSIVDYYCNLDNTYNESTDTNTLNYNGVEYADVKIDAEVLQNEWNDDIYTFQVRYLCRVPKGYDGLVATVIARSKINDKGLSDTAPNDDNVFFRLK